MACHFVHCRVCGREGHNSRKHATTSGTRLKRKRRVIRRAEQSRRDLRRAQGLCWNCGADARPFRQCYNCRQKRSQRKTRWRHATKPQ